MKLLGYLYSFSPKTSKSLTFQSLMFHKTFMFCLHNKKWYPFFQNHNDYRKNHDQLECLTFRSFFSCQKKQIAKVLNLHDCLFNDLSMIFPKCTELWQEVALWHDENWNFFLFYGNFHLKLEGISENRHIIIGIFRTMQTSKIKL